MATVVSAAPAPPQPPRLPQPPEERADVGREQFRLFQGREVATSGEF